MSSWLPSALGFFAGAFVVGHIIALRLRVRRLEDLADRKAAEQLCEEKWRSDGKA